MALYLSDEYVAEEKKRLEKYGMKATFVEAEHVGGSALGNLLDSIHENNPDATLDDVQSELDHFAGVIVEFQDHYGHDAPLSLLA